MRGGRMKKKCEMRGDYVVGSFEPDNFSNNQLIYLFCIIIYIIYIQKL